MALDLALLILIGLGVDWLFKRARIPGLVGMLLAGIILGPACLGLISPAMAAASSDFRRIALIVILLRAGFEMGKDTLKKVGMRALLFSFIPAIFEGTAITLLGPWLLGLTHLESAMLGSVVAAVSPAVVVPLMIGFMDRKKGTAKGIPTLILAASSLDDVFVIVVYSSLIGLYIGGQSHLLQGLVGIPISIVMGIGVGLLCGWVLYKIFERFNPRATKRLLVVLGMAILLVHLEQKLEGIVPFASLLAVMAIGFVVLEKNEYMAHEISAKLAKLWVFAEILLFVLVGAQVNVRVAWSAGASGALLVLLGLVARSAGSYLCLVRSDLNFGERMFVVVSYLPKATVQAAIGGAALIAMRATGMNTQPGEIILAVAVLSVLLTAPAGAWAIKRLGEHVLREEVLVRTDYTTPERARKDVLESLTVGDVMERDPISVHTGARLENVMQAFSQSSFMACPVADKHGKVAGMIRMQDVQPLLASQHTWSVLLAEDAMIPVPVIIHPGDFAEQALKNLREAQTDVLPVLDAQSQALRGMLSVQMIEKAVASRVAERLFPQA